MSERQPHPDKSAVTVPANFRRVMERWQRLLPDLTAGENLRAEIDRRVAQVDELFAPYDAIHLLGQFVLSETAIWEPDEYRESEHSGSAYVVELAAAILARRPSRAGEQSPSPAIDAHALDPGRERIEEIALIEGLRRYRRALGASSDSLGIAQARTAVQHLMLRGPSWPDQEIFVLQNLFGQEHVSRRLRDVLGFDARDGVACAEALSELLHGQMSAQADAAKTNRRREALDWASQALIVSDDAPEDIRDDALAIVWLLTHLGEAMQFTPDNLAAQASVSPDAAAAFVCGLSTPFGQTGDLFAIAERIRERPYLDLGDGSYVRTVGGNDLWALRGIFETALKGSESYTKHRARWLERSAADRLADTLPPDEIHFGVGLFSVDRGEQLGEVDAMVRYGDTVITLEGKSSTRRAGARRGGQALIDHLEQNLTKAAEQASIARCALTGKAHIELRTNEGQRLTLGADIREVHPVVVTLDDLSSVAPVLWELAGSSVLPSDVTIPWVVTWYELDLVCRLVQWPPQLIHFLRRRSRLNELGRFHASDELDWWMLYLRQGLYFEDNEEIRVNGVRYLSLTDPLDAWVMWERGIRTTEAPKPRHDLDPETERFLDFLTKERPPGWISTGCALLEISGQARTQFHDHLETARQRAAERQTVQRGTLGFTGPPRDFLISWVVVPNEGRPVLEQLVRDYVSERLDDFGVQPVVAFGLLSSSERPFDSLLVLELATWQPSQSQEAKTMGRPGVGATER
jgi:hypothetical protein